MPHVKVSVGFYLKDKPEGYLGLTQETWTLGKKPTSFASLVWGFIGCLLEFYLVTMPTSTHDLNAEIQEVGRVVLGLKVEEKQDVTLDNSA